MVPKKNFRRQWWKIDLHLHSPASGDWQEPDVSYVEWLQKAEARGLDVVAITDHNTVAGVARLRQEIERLQWLESQERLRPQEKRDLDEYRRLGDKLLVLPGFEFTAMFGFHVLAIFPPETSVRELELLLLRLNVPAAKLDAGSTEIGASSDVLTAYRLIDEAGGLVIAAHVNSTHGVAMRDMPFGGQTKIAFTQDAHLHALEVTDLDSRTRRATASFFNGSKPEYPRRMHCIQGSDAHRLHRHPTEKHQLGIGDRVTEISLPEVSFEAIAAVLKGVDFSLTRPYRLKEAPFDFVLAAREQGPNIVQSFHEQWSRADGQLTAILADVVAFANAGGGSIFIGVSGSTRGAPLGVAQPDAALTEIAEEIRRNVMPLLNVVVDTLETQGKTVLRITVPPSNDKPYCLDDNKIYVRQEAETTLAVRDEIVQLVRSALLDSTRVESTPIAAMARAKPARRRRKTKSSTTSELSPVLPSEPTDFSLSALVSAEIVLPRVGVEILNVDETRGAPTYTIKDLRNGGIVRNVTSKSARKLWSYAIVQRETNPVDAARVQWAGDVGVWQSDKRAGKVRYDLALRSGDVIRVFYGVTEDGMEGPWQQFLTAADD